MKNFRVLGIASFLALGVASTSALADIDPMSGVIKAIKEVGLEVQALAIASKKSVSNMKYQLDKNLDLALQADVEKNNALQTVKNNAGTNTQNQISGTLLQFPEQVINASQLNDAQMAATIKNRKNLIPNLTTAIPASDTLYLTDAEDPLANTYGVAKPDSLYDNYFNFDSLFAPSAYNSDQQQAATTYLQYLTKPYQSLTDNIHFSELKDNLNKLSAEKRADKLKSFLNNPAYQKFQLAVRSLIATKSIAIDNFNTLLNERVPVKGLGAKVGMPDDPHLPKGYASPLQVENYIANQRINSPDWFKQMKTASPAVVAREQVLILAEIESQLERNHLDNERLLATLSLMALQGTKNSEMELQTNTAADLNKLIDQIGK
ncbi:phosphoesterase [Coxiella burnetii]|uniref:IcmX n=1 Tax=Coxiella burnetii (strain Dugway 5J108-111) TaxID=434922 RepID=A9KDJ4_COXBN|nr:phosphoesterase [Coxiella burnetii]ABS77624.1 IcmX [Coxiella burnetii Dugway 5J108-111]ACJ17800.1 IcmX [Coxiella burnetii CbuG_Q212]ATN66238.1 phosphoesterase [Coxiella burnetii]OYK80915.1 phosphoesterase [Coxiella burnetii]OYK83003.1 phosphoesterase [Coxiella burnetii]